MPVSTDRALAGPIVEYLKLKDEQLARISDRDHLVYANLVACASIGAFVLEHPNRLLGLLAAPAVSFVLGSLHLANDLRVSSIGRYVHEQLRTQFEPEYSEVLQWEAFHKAEPSRTLVKLFELLALFVAFLLPGFGCIAFVVMHSEPLTVMDCAALSVEVAALSALGLVMISQAVGEVSGGHQRRRHS